MFYHQKVARVRVFADIQNFALRAHCVRTACMAFPMHTKSLLPSAMHREERPFSVPVVSLDMVAQHWQIITLHDSQSSGCSKSYRAIPYLQHLILMGGHNN